MAKRNDKHASAETQKGHHAGTRGGTHEQHVKAGHAGGSAEHECRGRQCSEKGKGSSSEENE